MQTKRIAVIASPSEFKAFKTFLKLVVGIEFVRVDSFHQLQCLELCGFIDTGTIKNSFIDIVPIAKTRIR